MYVNKRTYQPTLCVGIDIGITTMATCYINKENNAVVGWFLDNLLDFQQDPVIGKRGKPLAQQKPSITELLDMMILTFDRHVEELDDMVLERVTIECQPHMKNPRFKDLSVALAMYYKLRFPRAEVKMVLPESKFRSQTNTRYWLVEWGEKVPKSYMARKRASVKMALHILILESDMEAAAFLERQKKTDDLADAFLLALLGV
jgi:hypothetical protein